MATNSSCKFELNSANLLINWFGYCSCIYGTPCAYVVFVKQISHQGTIRVPQICFC